MGRSKSSRSLKGGRSLKCAILMYNYVPDESPTEDKRTDCIGEKCAWWSESLDQCDPTGLLPHFIALGNVLGKIADRMPKDLAPGGR